MAGLGRRSHYRKHLTDAVLNDLPEPDESIGQRIARVMGTRGGNMFDVIVAPLAQSTTGENTSDKQLQSTATETETSCGDLPLPIHNIRRAPQLAFLPTKFRKLVWIKRNDFVIVECGEEEDEETQQQRADQKDSSSGVGFRYVISHILYKDQVKHIKAKGLWPLDPFFIGEDPVAKPDEKYGDQGEKEDENNDEEDGDANDLDGTYEDNGIVFEDPLGDDLMVNTNRIATLRVEDSSSDEDSDHED